MVPDGLDLATAATGPLLNSLVLEFVVRDPDGHRFTLGRGEEALRDVADHYGLGRDEIAVDPAWLHHRQG